MKHTLFLLILVTALACSRTEQRTVQLLSNSEKAIVQIPQAYNLGDTIVVYYDYSYEKYKYAINWRPFEAELMASDDFKIVYHKAVIIK